MVLGSGVITTAVMEVAGYRKLRGNGQVYNLNPIELDANGAASGTRTGC